MPQWSGQLRVGVVSATGSGLKRTVPALDQSEICSVSAIHGRDPSRVADGQSQFAIPNGYTNLEVMLNEQLFDMLYLASPPFLHLAEVEACAELGVPIMIEKPLAGSLGDGIAIAEMLRTTSSAVAVAHHLRSQSAFEKIVDIVHSGILGAPLHATFEWSFLLNRSSRNSTWKLNPDLNGPTCLSDAGVHCIDAALGIFGECRVAGVSGQRSRGDRTFELVDVLLQHDLGVVHVTSSRLWGPYANDLRIAGPDGQLVVPGFFGEAASPIAHLGDQHGARQLQFSITNPYRQEVEDFAIRAFDLDVPPVGSPTSLDDALAALRVIDEVAMLLDG